MFRVISWLSILAWAYPAFIWYSNDGVVASLWPFCWAVFWPLFNIVCLYLSETDPEDPNIQRGLAIIAAAIGVWVLSGSIEKHTISKDEWERQPFWSEKPSSNPFDPSKSFEQRRLYNEFKSTLGE